MAFQIDRSVCSAVPTMNAVVGMAELTPCPDGNATAAVAHPTSPGGREARSPSGLRKKLVPFTA
jgi:hypothetical protein